MARKLFTDPTVGGSNLTDIKMSPIYTFNKTDHEVSNNVVINIDVTEFNFTLIDLTGSTPQFTNGGKFIININGIDTSVEHALGHIQVKGLIYKPIVEINVTGISNVKWLLIPDFRPGFIAIDLIHYYTTPLAPNTIYLSHIDSRKV